MKKTVTETTNRTISVCDLCEADSSLQRCWVCQRECCYQCRKLLFAGKHNELVEFAINVCAQCQQHFDIIERIREIMATANAGLREWTDWWKKAAKEAKSC